MTMPKVNTDDDGMGQAIKVFDAQAHDFTGILGAVNLDMRELQRIWTGRASVSFARAMDDWENSFKKVIDELIRMLEVMGQTSQGYKNAEEQAAAGAQSFASAFQGLPGF